MHPSLYFTLPQRPAVTLSIRGLILSPHYVESRVYMCATDLRLGRQVAERAT